MAPKRFPTLRAQWLGREMRKHRIDANLTLVDAGQYLQRDQGTVSRMENGLVPARVADITALLNYYGVDDPTVRATLEVISRDAWQRGWWDGYSKYAPAWMLDLAWMEGRARRIRSFDPLVLHGILQTEAYARAVILAADPDAGKTKIENWVELRMKRHEVLAGDDPTQFQAIIDETVLRRNIGGPQVMREQCKHLLDLAENSPVHIQVLPGQIDAHPALDGPFALIDLPDPYPVVGHIDTVAGNLWLEADEAEAIAKRYDHLATVALTPAESADLIRKLIKGHT